MRGREEGVGGKAEERREKRKDKPVIDDATKKVAVRFPRHKIDAWYLYGGFSRPRVSK